VALASFRAVPGTSPTSERCLLVFLQAASAVMRRGGFAAALLGAIACQRGQPEGATRSVAHGVDDFGDTIRLASAPSRIVSLNPTTTEILFAIGAGARLVGRSTYDGWPADAKQVADLGPGIKPNVEAIIAARPDLVLLYASTDNRPAAERLRAAGIPTASFKVDSIAEFDRLTRLLGRLVGDSARGALVADTVMRTLDSVRALMKDVQRVTVVIPAWHEPLMVIGGGSFMSQLVEIAGGRNVYADIAAPSPTVTFEDVLKRNPQFVLVGPESGARIKAQSKWRALPAVRNNRLLILDTATVLRPATRLGEAAVSLAKQLHPDRIR
jgi:iron complex transport system substrate-binding protein